MVEYVSAWLRDRNIRFEHQPVRNDQLNVIATLPGSGGATIVFDAHTDTVPADDWLDRAFTPRSETGRIYGRGSCDTKGSLAAMMIAFERAAHLKDRPHTVVLLASADEEVSRTGLRTYLAGRPAIDYAVVGEPTCCQPVVACKGAARWDIVTRGKSAHTSNPQEGINAIARMSRVLALLEECERTVLAVRRHPLVSGRTLTPSVIRGGNAINVVPAECRVSVDLRTLPGESPAAAMQEVQQFLAGRCDFPVEHDIPEFWDGADAPVSDAFVANCIEICRKAAGSGEKVEPKGVSYGCHAGDYAGCGVPAVVIGPGDIAVAHAVDEYVPVSDLERAVEIYFSIMTRAIAG
jgi:acetylornithine deacetylase